MVGDDGGIVADIRARAKSVRNGTRMERLMIERRLAP
jgi:hypothetical protein